MFNIFQKLYDILVILVDFCGNFQWFGWYYAYPDPFHETNPNPEPGCQNETDPNGSGFETLHWKEWSINKI